MYIMELTAQQGHFDNEHQLQKKTESGTCSCNSKQRVQLWESHCCEGGVFWQQSNPNNCQKHFLAIKVSQSPNDTSFSA